MATIVTRSGKGSPLTNTEVDANFTNLNSDKLELSGGTMTGNLAITAASSPTITLTDTTNTAILKVYSQDTESIIGTYSNHNLGLFTNSTRALTIDTSQNASFAGNVDVTGIFKVGTYAAAQLKVNGYSSTYRSIQIGAPDNNGGSVALAIDVSAFPDTAGNFAGKDVAFIGKNGLIFPNAAENNWIGGIARGTSSDVIHVGPATTGGASSGPLTLTSTDATFAGHIELADSKYLKLGADADFIIYHDGTSNYVQAAKQDSDIIFRGNDGGTGTNMLTLDTSAAGEATFNAGATFAGDVTAQGLQVSDNITFDGISANAYKGIVPETDQNLMLGTGSGGEPRIYLKGTANGQSDAGDLFLGAGTGGTIILNGPSINFKRPFSLFGTTNTTEELARFSNNAESNRLLITQEGSAGYAVKSSTELELHADYDNNTSAGGSNIRLFTDNSERMRVTDTGRVGIGLTSPTSPLTVKSDSTSSSDSGITLQGNGNTNAIFKVGEKSTDGGRLHMYDGGTEKIAFYTDGTANHISAGNLGIGTSSPGNIVEVSGASPVVEINATSGNPELQFSDGGTDEFSMYYDTGANAFKFVEGAVGTKLTIADGGDATFAGNLDVDGSAGIYQRNSSGGSIVLDDTDTADGSTPMGYLRNTAGQLTLGRSNRNATTGLTTGAAESLPISSAGDAEFAGDIGLGVAGSAFGSGTPTINFKGTSSTYAARAGALRFKGNDGDDVAALYVTDGSDGHGTVLCAYQGPIRFSTGTLSSSRLTISSAGDATFSGTVTSSSTSGAATFVAYRNQTTLPSSGDGANLIGAYLFQSSDSSGSEPHYAGIGGFSDQYGRMELQFFTERDNWDSDPRVPTLTLDRNKDATLAGNLTLGDGHSIGNSDDGSDNLEIASSAGENLILDSGNSIYLDHDSDSTDSIYLRRAGGTYAYFRNSSDDLLIGPSGEDHAIFFQGNDSGSTINMLKLDASAYGDATFSGHAILGGKLTVSTTIDGVGAPAAGTGILGATAAYGAILTGQGSTNDVTISNDAGQTALVVPTGTRDVIFSGDVGIGSGGAPSLSSTDLIFQVGSSSYDNPTIQIRSGTSGTGKLWFGDKSGSDAGRYAGFVEYNHNTITVGGSPVVDDYMRFGIGSAEKMRLDIDGNLGIGSTNPDGVLDLGNGTAGRGIVWGGTTGANNYGGIWSEYGSASIIIGAGLKSPYPTANAGFRVPYTGTYGYAAIELDSWSDDGMKFYVGPDAAVTKDDVITPNEVMRIATNGRVGIATTAPESLLHLGGESPTLTLKDVTNGCKLLVYSQDTESIVGTYSAHNLGFFTDGDRTLTLDTSHNATFVGQVTAGTSGGTVALKPADGGGNTSVEIQAATGKQVYLDLGGADVTDYFARIIADQAGGTGTQFISKNGLVLDPGTGAVHLKYGDTEKLATSSSGVTVTGYLGVGETSPDTPVHVKIQGEPPAAGMMILEANASNYPGSRQLRIQPPTTSSNGFIDYRGGNLLIKDDGSEVARFQSNTSFLYGTTNTNPAGADTAGVALTSASGISVQGTTTALTIGVPSAQDYGMAFRYQGNLAGRIGIDANNITLADVSDYRLKENIAPLTDTLKKIKALKPSTFNFISHPDKTHEGFVAHELQKVIPYAVTGEKDALITEATKDRGTVGDIDPQAVDLRKLVPTLVAAIQEQQSLIESLTARIESLEE